MKFNWGYKTTIAGTTREQIRRCRETGCTKIHFGVESANNEGLDSFGKHCDTDDVHRVFKWCREEGVRSVAYIAHEARADAMIIATACDQIVAQSRTVLGGEGAASIRAQEIDDLRGAIQAIAQKKSRNWSTTTVS